MAAVRAAAGPEVALRLDANGAWSVEEAVRAIEALSPAGLELVEEPTHGLQAVRAVRERVAVRVAIDETAAEHGALGAGVADAVCLKISRCGGIAGLLAAADARARLRRGGLPRLDARRPARRRRRRARRRRARLARAARRPAAWRRSRLFAGLEDPLPRARAADRAARRRRGSGVEPL